MFFALSSPAPAVSVVLPVYNAGPYLRAALDSISAQSFAEFEFIAVDDGSTDDSLAILRRHALQDSRLVVITRPNTGIVGALNDGLAAARGEFVARMDGDDLALPGRFAAQLAHLRDHPRCVAVGTDVLYVDPEGAPLVRHRPALLHDPIVAQLLAGNGGALIHPSVIFRRVAVEQAGRYRASYNWIEDLDLYLRLSDLGQLANLPEVSLHYRQHPNSVNRTRGDREALRLELVNPRRRARGLPALAASVPAPTAPQSRADWRRHWAYEAVRGGQTASARKNAWRACLTGPQDYRNWQCLRYTLAHAA